MNEYLSGFLLGFVQGLTEFLPVSSSGHLALLASFGVGNSSVALSLSLHAATLLAVFVALRREIFVWVRHPFSPRSKFLLLATFPTAVIAGVARYLLPQTADYLPTAFMATSVLLLLPSVFRKQPFDYLGKGWQRRALFVGAMQGLACLNGVSRSGATVAAGEICGMGEESGENSFLLSVPIILGSSIVEGIGGGFAEVPVGSLIVGGITAFSVGIIAIKGFLKVIKKRKFAYFSIYTFFLSVFCFLRMAL